MQTRLQLYIQRVATGVPFAAFFFQAFLQRGRRIWGERGRGAERQPEPLNLLFGVQISPGDAESLWSMELPPRPKLRVCTARADGEEGRAEETEGDQEEDCEEGGPKETEGGQEEGYPEEEMSGLKKQKELTQVCGATDPSSQQHLACRQVQVPRVGGGGQLRHRVLNSV